MQWRSKSSLIVLRSRVLIIFIAEKARSAVAVETGRVITSRNNLSTIGYEEALPDLTSPFAKPAIDGKVISSGWLHTSS